jgi:squalene cyclase
MSETHDCGHTDEEHAAQVEEMMKQVMQGNLAPVFQAMPSELLALNLEILIGEIFVRVPDDETFLHVMEGVERGAREILVEGRENEELREQLLENRGQYKQMVEEEAFAAEANDEISQLLDTYGVVPEKAPSVKDEWPGQYL